MLLRSETLALVLVFVLLVYVETRVHRMFTRRMDIMRGQMRRYERRASRLTQQPGVLATAMTEEPAIAEKLRTLPPRSELGSRPSVH